ncbi:MAG: archaeosortase/exosortase family protein [archaeon]|nr:MAG: archaeosortase/exosortase family protein [archaeon]
MAKGIQEESMIKNGELRETLFFLSKLLLLSVPLYLVIWLGLDLSPLQELVARTVQSFLNFAGYSVEREGFGLLIGNFSFYISRDCTGWKGLLFLAALIFATKAGWRKRALGLAAGLPAFFAFNLLRIMFMVWIGLGNRGLFYLLHDFLWQFSMIAVVLLLWLMWNGVKEP